MPPGNYGKAEIITCRHPNGRFHASVVRTRPAPAGGNGRAELFVTFEVKDCQTMVEALGRLYEMSMSRVSACYASNGGRGGVLGNMAYLGLPQ